MKLQTAAFSASLPLLLSALAEEGGAGHYLTGDSGLGASFGDFKGRTAGLGPVLSYATNVGGIDFIGELKWLHEMETRNRPEGDYVWFKLVAKF